MSYRRPRDALRGLDLEKDKGRDWKESDAATMDFRMPRG